MRLIVLRFELVLQLVFNLLDIITIIMELVRKIILGISGTRLMLKSLSA